MNNIHAKKSLGQNFLRSKEALNKIIEAGELTQTDTVLEIGPGKGVLTERLLEKARRVLAIEKDDRLIPELQTKFEKEISEGRLKLIHGDILETELDTIISKETPYKLIANIPYYITGEIIRRFLETSHQPEKIVFLLQKEVVKRIVARDLKESILSLSVKVYGTPRSEGVVKKEAFSPSPKVDSAILSISNISKENFKDVSEDMFFKVVRSGFAQKRKKLTRNLEAVVPKERIEKVFEELQIDKNTRAEDVLLEKWLIVSKEIAKN